MTDLKTFIEINRHFMTPTEMAGETKEHVGKIRGILARNNWQAITETERVREYIQENKDASIEHIAAKFGKTGREINRAARELGIVLKTKAEIERKLSFTSLLFQKWEV